MTAARSAEQPQIVRQGNHYSVGRSTTIGPAETVRSEDFRGIELLARRLGYQLTAGIVLYTGGQRLPFGDRLRA